MTEAQNSEPFRDAVARLRQTEADWQLQADLAVGHPTKLVVDFDSLGGRFERVGPFVNGAIAGVLGALCKVGFDPARRSALSAAVWRVTIAAAGEGEALRVEMKDDALRVQVPVAAGQAEATGAIARAIEGLLGVPASPAPGASGGGRRVAAALVWGDEKQRGRASLSDPHVLAGEYMDRLEAAMRGAGVWPGEKPAGDVEVKGAFGSENMPYERWLAWVLIPRVREIASARGAFPAGSAVGVYAVRALNGLPGAGEVIDVLTEFDEFIESLRR